MTLIAPALLAADFANLGEALRTVKEAGCRMVHIDAGDGHFSAEITVGQPVVESIRKATDLELDLHLMIEEPERYVAEFVHAGANRLAVHPESTAHLYQTIRTIQRAGAKAGVALEPGTPPGRVQELLPVVDFLTILSAEAGAEEDQFIEATVDKIKEVRRLREEMGLSLQLEVEGGIGLPNVRELVGAGADILVIGSAIFGEDDPASLLGEFFRLISPVEGRAFS